MVEFLGHTSDDDKCVVETCVECNIQGEEIVDSTTHLSYFSSNLFDDDVVAFFRTNP